MDGVLMTVGVALTFTFSGPGPGGPPKAPVVRLHGGYQAVSVPMPRPAPTMPIK